MKYTLSLVSLLSSCLLMAAEIEPANDLAAFDELAVYTELNDVQPNVANKNSNNCGQELMGRDSCVRIEVLGQGVSPLNTSSPAQAYALAKRAAIADSYRLIAEKVNGVRVDGQDTIKNMMIKSSTVRTSVCAVVKNANIVETTFKEGLCEVEMEITVYHSQILQ